jgi:hypothetical protein
MLTFAIQTAAFGSFSLVVASTIVVEFAEETRHKTRDLPSRPLLPFHVVHMPHSRPRLWEIGPLGASRLATMLVAAPPQTSNGTVWDLGARI